MKITVSASRPLGASLRLSRRLVLLGAALSLAGCMDTTDAQKVSSTPPAFTVTSVTVQVKEEAKVSGRFAEDDALRKSVLERVDATTTEIAKTIGGGPQKTKAVVEVTNMSLKAGSARSFGAVNGIQGSLTIVDSAGKTIKGPVGVAYSDQAKNNSFAINGIPIGILVNLAQNDKAQQSGQDVDKLVDGFSQSIARNF